MKNSKRKFTGMDYVTALLTGKFQERFIKTENGPKKVQEFVPRIVNKHNSITTILSTSPKLSINEVLVEENLIQKPLVIDRNIFRKTIKEKQELKKAKKEYKDSLNTFGHKEGQKRLIKEIINSKTPRWGSFSMFMVD